MSDEAKPEGCWDAWFDGLADALKRRELPPQPQVFPLHAHIAAPEQNAIEMVDVGSFYPALPYEL